METAPLDRLKACLSAVVIVEMAQGERIESPLMPGVITDEDGLGPPRRLRDREGEDERRVRARLVSLRALKADKAETRDDAIVAAKDRADLATLVRFG